MSLPYGSDYDTTLCSDPNACLYAATNFYSDDKDAFKFFHSVQEKHIEAMYLAIKFCHN